MELTRIPVSRCIEAVVPNVYSSFLAKNVLAATVTQTMQNTSIFLEKKNDLNFWLQRWLGHYELIIRFSSAPDPIFVADRTIFWICDTNYKFPPDRKKKFFYNFWILYGEKLTPCLQKKITFPCISFIFKTCTFKESDYIQVPTMFLNVFELLHRSGKVICHKTKMTLCAW